MWTRRLCGLDRSILLLCARELASADLCTRLSPRAEGHGRLAGAVGSRYGVSVGRPWRGGSRWRLRLGGKGRLPPCWASAGGWTRLLRCSNQSPLSSGGGKNAWLNWSPSLPAPILFQQWADGPWVVGSRAIGRGPDESSHPALAHGFQLRRGCVAVLSCANFPRLTPCHFSPICQFWLDTPGLPKLGSR